MANPGPNSDKTIYHIMALLIQYGVSISYFTKSQGMAQFEKQTKIESPKSVKILIEAVSAIRKFVNICQVRTQFLTKYVIPHRHQLQYKVSVKHFLRKF